MSWAEVLRGLLFSFAACFLLSALFTFKLKVRPFLVERDAKRLRPKPVRGSRPAPAALSPV
jgi:hypothetical protein